ncbi:YihY/virulence factor BrkB family protein [Nocardia veterana]|uniref:YihY/virulence factor BrkB family protein n=1 Tax=Nocardia veterana TaxID=132249 RepID=A0A7X6RJA3_9NOCA|nr:YihY/virulence factor BrkB family protein [Nocardia veterana]NKY88011.1 YihY/virulence factor BrkB family protein [Nocardia veterana]
MAVLRRVWAVIARVAVKAWADSIFAKSAAAAFWQTLSLAPLLLGLLGSIGYVGGLFGPDTVHIVEGKIISFSRNLFSSNVVDEMIAPTVRDVLQRGRGAVVSVGFVLSLWAGSSAMATFVDAIVAAHGQADARHPVWQRIFALGLYLLFLVAAVFVLPLVALGPTLIGRALPEGWREPGLRLIDNFYYPAAGLLLIVGLTTLYKLALHRSLPWHRLFGGALVAGIFFMTASDILRRYLTYAARAGVSYGALATPIAFLLFTFFLAFAVILGAEFNATVQEFWPARATRFEQLKQWWARRRQRVAAAAPPPAEPAAAASRSAEQASPASAESSPAGGPDRTTAPDQSAGGESARFDSAAGTIGDRNRKRIRPAG